MGLDGYTRDERVERYQGPFAFLNYECASKAKAEKVGGSLLINAD